MMSVTLHSEGRKTETFWIKKKHVGVLRIIKKHLSTYLA